MSKEKRRKLSNKVVTVILILVFLTGLSVLCYPSVSSWWNAGVQSRAVASYDQSLLMFTEADYSEYFAMADAFNEKVREVGSISAISDPDQFDDYYDILDVTGTGIMGYVTIDKIGVELPIYHGTDSKALSKGAGHLEGTSLPVGGEGTHAVISAHRGLPSARLFTNLDQLEEGDIFTVTVLDEILTYRIDQIEVVLPTQIEELFIQDGKDYCTLMTCTPYGINTHRLLVRGIRTQTPDFAQIRVTADAYRIDLVLVAPFVAAVLLLILFIWLFVSTRSRKNKRRRFQ